METLNITVKEKIKEVDESTKAVKPKKKNPNIDHIYYNTMRNGRLECGHCGATWPLDKLINICNIHCGGLDLDYWSAISKVFRRKHRYCKLTDAGRRLQKKEKKYFIDSQIHFKADKDQLLALVNSIPENCAKYEDEKGILRGRDHTVEEFKNLNLWALNVPIRKVRDIEDKTEEESIEASIEAVDSLKDVYFIIIQTLPNAKEILHKLDIEIVKEATAIGW